MEKIEAGVLSDLASGINGMFGFLDKVFKKFVDLGLDADDKKSQKVDKFLLVNKQDPTNQKPYTFTLTVITDEKDINKYDVIVEDSTDSKYIAVLKKNIKDLFEPAVITVV